MLTFLDIKCFVHRDSNGSYIEKSIDLLENVYMICMSSYTSNGSPYRSVALTDLPAL